MPPGMLSLVARALGLVAAIGPLLALQAHLSYLAARPEAAWVSGPAPLAFFTAAPVAFALRAWPGRRALVAAVVGLAIIAFVAALLAALAPEPAPCEDTASCLPDDGANVVALQLAALGATAIGLVLAGIALGSTGASRLVSVAPILFVALVLVTPMLLRATTGAADAATLAWLCAALTLALLAALAPARGGRARAGQVEAEVEP